MTETYWRETNPSETDNVATKITSGSAAGAGMPEGFTTGAGTAGFGAASAAAGGGSKAGSSWSLIANAARGGCSAQGNLSTTFTKLRRTGQGAAKTVLLEVRAARHHARQDGICLSETFPCYGVIMHAVRIVRLCVK